MYAYFYESSTSDSIQRILGKSITATIYMVKLVHYLTVHQACEQAADASTTALHAIKEARIASNAANLAAQVIA